MVNFERLHELIDAWRDGTLSDQAAAELSQLLRNSDKARRIFRAESQMHGLLHQAVTAAAVEEAAGRGSRPVRPGAAERLEKSRRLEARIISRRQIGGAHV